MAAAEDLPVRVGQGEGWCCNKIRRDPSGEKAGDPSRVCENAEKGRHLMECMKTIDEMVAGDKAAPVLADE